MTRNEFEEKYISELTFDEPINIGGINLYPVPLRNYYKFNMYTMVLTIKKDRIPDKKIITMSYMEYLANLIMAEKTMDDSEKIMTYCFASLLKEVLRDDNAYFEIRKNKNNKRYFVINDVEFTAKMFNDFKDIVLFQNIPNYDGIELNEDLEKDIMEADRIRNMGKKSCSLEKQIMSASVETSLPLESIKELTIRKFFILIEMKDKEISYKIAKSAELSGMVTFKEEIQHYLTEKDTTSLDGKIISYDKLQQKLGSVSKFN